MVVFIALSQSEQFRVDLTFLFHFYFKSTLGVGLLRSSHPCQIAQRQPDPGIRGSG